MTPDPIPGAVRGETAEQAERRATIEATFALSHDEYRRRLADLLRPAPAPIPVPLITKNAWEMSDEEFAAARVAIMNGTPVTAAETTPVEAPQPGVESGTTASTARPPAPATGGPRSVWTMTETEWRAAKASLLSSGR